MTGCSTDSQAASRPVPQFDANTKVIALTFDDAWFWTSWISTGW